MLAGRVRELRAVAAVLDGTSGAAAMLVAGEAGVGKTRLISAAAAQVSDAEVLVLSGWCLPLSQGLPLLPIADVVRAVGHADEGRLVKAALADCPRFVGGEVNRLVPDISGSDDAPSPADVDDGWRRQRLFDALARLLAAVAGLRRLAVVIEDLQWADLSTLEFLEYLFAPGRAFRVPVVVTCRTEDAPGETLAGWLERLQRHPRAVRLDLEPMSISETGDQIALLQGFPPSPEFVGLTYDRSEGNAFFTEQLVTAGSAVDAEVALSAGLRSLLLARTAPVTGTSRQVLAALAIAGRPLDELSLGWLCDSQQDRLRAALRELIVRRLLRRPDTTDRYQLRHALLAEVISGELLPSERADLHIAVAELMASWNQPALAAPIAEHYAAAGRPGDELRWRVIAGRRATSVFAATEAAAQWERAVALTAGRPLTMVVEGMSVAALYGAAQDALDVSGADDASLALADQGLVRLVEVDPSSRADALRRAGWTRARLGDPGGLDLLYEALAIYQQLPPSPGHVSTLRDIRSVLSNAGRQAEAAAVDERAVAVAERAGQRSDRLEILAVRAWDEMSAGNGSLALEEIRALHAQLTEQDGPALAVFVAVLHTDILLTLGRLDEVPDAAAVALRFAAAHGMERAYMAALLRVNVIEALVELGSVDAAAEVITPCTGGVAEPGNRFDYTGRAIVETFRGDLADAQRRWLELEALPPIPLSFRIGGYLRHGELQLWQGRPDAVAQRAEALLREAIDADAILSGSVLAFVGPLLVLALRGCAEQAEQARATRDGAALAAAASTVDRLQQLHASMTPDPFTPGPMRHTAEGDFASWCAELSRLNDQSDSAAWERAATVWDAFTRPLRAGYCRWRQAEALLARPGGKPAATPVLRAATAQAVQHVPLAAAIHDLARRARIDLTADFAAVRTDKRLPKSSMPFGLTDRELAVLRLLAEGKTNAQIGAELFISAKTASVHVTHILRKLDVATRVQAAAVAERGGLLTADAGGSGWLERGSR